MVSSTLRRVWETGIYICINLYLRKVCISVQQRYGYVMSCDPNVQYNIVLILQSDRTRHTF